MDFYTFLSFLYALSPAPFLNIANCWEYKEKLHISNFPVHHAEKKEDREIQVEGTLRCLQKQPRKIIIKIRNVICKWVKARAVTCKWNCPAEVLCIVARGQEKKERNRLSSGSE